MKSNKRLGPRPAMIARLLITNPIFWIAGFNFLFFAFKPVRLSIYNLLETAQAGRLVIGYYEALVQYNAHWVFLLVLAAVCSAAAIAYLTTSYVLDENDDGSYVLTLNYGLFVRGGPNSGLFTISSDTRLVSMISDCDPSRNLFDIIFKMGCLEIKSANESGNHAGRVSVPFMPLPMEVTHFLMEHSKIKEARMYTSV